VTAAETTATGSRSRADAVDYASFTWSDLSGMSRTNAVKTSEPHLIHQDTDKTLTKTKNSPEQEQPQGIQFILPVDSTKPVQRPEKKAPKPLESLLGIGQNFVAPKSDEADGLTFSNQSRVKTLTRRTQNTHKPLTLSFMKNLRTLRTIKGLRLQGPESAIGTQSNRTLAP
jgi:hypothetical protein